MRCVAFPVTEYDEVLSGYQLADSLRELHHITNVSQMLKQWHNITVFTHIFPIPQAVSFLTKEGRRK
jgi:hypothetical protein